MPNLVGTIRARTAREGVAARVGHDLLLGFPVWSGELVVGPDGSVSVEVEVDVASIEVVEGTGGAVPLTTDDRRDIAANARRLLDADRQPHATFRATVPAPAPVDWSGRLEGALTLAGRTVPLALDVVVTEASAWTASATVLQSAYGITPYRAFLGVLRVADAVQVEVAVGLASDP